MTIRHVLTAMLSFSLFAAYTASAFGGGPAKPFHIRVSSREIENRIVESRVRDHMVRIDQPEEFGADDTAPTPPEYLAISLGSCVVSTIRFVAMLENLKIDNIEVTVEGEIDFSRAMGLASKNRAGFSGLSVTVGFDSDMSPESKKAFIDKVFRRGAAIDNLMNSTPVDYRISE